MHYKAILHYIIIVLAITSCSIKKQEGIAIYNYHSDFVFTDKTTESCHAATLVETTNNHLLASWFGGTYEGAKDVSIYSSEFDGSLWSQPKCIIKPMVQNNDTLPCWNPVLFKSKSNLLYLFYKVGKNPREWFGAMITSNDMGKSWSKPKILPKGFLGPIKNKPIEVDPGIIICGSSTESIQNNEWRVHVEKYNEQTNEWELIPVSNSKNYDVIQPTFITHEKSAIQMLCRSKHNKVITSFSYDKGNSWSNLDTLNVPNSNSGIDAISINKNCFLMVNNPLKHGTEWFNGRNKLDVEYSNDGMEWKKLIDLENQDKGQFSYPAIIQASDRKIHVLYTYNRDYIKHTTFQVK